MKTDDRSAPIRLSSPASAAVGKPDKEGKGKGKDKGKGKGRAAPSRPPSPGKGKGKSPPPMTKTAKRVVSSRLPPSRSCVCVAFGAFQWHRGEGNSCAD